MVTKAAVPFLQIVTVTNPVPGGEFTLKAPGQGIWVVRSLSFILTTSAAVANRRVALLADDQTDTWFATVSTVDVAASLAVRFGAYPGAAATGLTAVQVTMPLPIPHLLLQPGHRLRTSTTLIDATDQYSAIRAQVQEYPQGPDFEWLPTYDTLLSEMG